MNAVKFDPSTKTVKLVQTTIPTVTQDWEVLVKVAYSGVCGTDLHIVEGEFPCENVILGHEFSGIVVDYGSAVKNLTRGDFVVVDPNNGCHKCNYCHSKQPHFCTSKGRYCNLGTRNNGGWAQYCICSMEQVHKLPEGISLKTAAFAEPLSCISHGWDLVSPITVGRDILVVGAGIIGILWASLFHFQGHRKVTVAEINLSKLVWLKELFVDRGFKMVTPEELKDGLNTFDVVVDCTGNCSAIEMGFSLLRRGGKMCIFGVAPATSKIMVSPFDIYMKELTILSVNINPFSMQKAIGLIEAMGETYLSYDKLGIQIFKQEDFSNALEQLKSGNITKAIFEYV